MSIELFLGLATIANIAFTAYMALRRAPYQNTSDAAGAIEKFQGVAVSLRAQIEENEKKQEESDKRIEHLTSLLENAHLTMTIGLQIGKKPEVLDYSWTTRGQVPPFVDVKQ